MKYLKNAATLTLDTHKCTGCGQCLDVCPHQVFQMHHRKAVIFDRDSCMECGACQTNCPWGAITVQAGVGCAYAILNGMIHGTAPSCGCGGEPTQPGCC
jgi:NAD-dependent dihydropyrimidine dehydrogenase PreA subunit